MCCCPVLYCLSCLNLCCLVLSCLVLGWVVWSCLVLSCAVLSSLVSSCLALSCFVLFCCLTTPYHLVSSRIIWFLPFTLVRLDNCLHHRHFRQILKTARKREREELEVESSCSENTLCLTQMMAYAATMKVCLVFFRVLLTSFSFSCPYTLYLIP